MSGQYGAPNRSYSPFTTHHSPIYRSLVMRPSRICISFLTSPVRDLELRSLSADSPSSTQMQPDRPCSELWRLIVPTSLEELQTWYLQLSPDTHANIRTAGLVLAALVV